MTPAEILDALIVWTPYLAVGFVWNIIVSLTAMGIGTPVGIALALLRNGTRRRTSKSGSLLTTFARNVPTFVMLFYLAYIIPPEFSIFGISVGVPPWLKASLALSFAVAGYVSDNALAAVRHMRRRERAEALLFLPAWTGYFLIIVMASSTASVIGVPELLSRTDIVIAAIGEPDVALWFYLYAMCWFFAFSLPMVIVTRLVSREFHRRAHHEPQPEGLGDIETEIPLTGK